MSVIAVSPRHGRKWKLNERVSTAARLAEHSSQEGSLAGTRRDGGWEEK